LQELQHYLNHIRVYWDKVIDGDPNVQPLIDFRTIQLLQTRNPWASRDDRDFIIDLMDRKQLFPMIQDTAMRSRILNNLQIADCMIPSLYTFFEDIKWLAPCAKVIRDLLPDGCRESTRRALSRCYTGVNQRAGTVRIEHRNPGFIDALGSEVQAVDSGYQQLWLFAWRHFSELSGDLPRKDVGRPKPRFIASNEQCWFRLAQLAGSLGFESEKITPLQTKDPDLKMAYAFLLQARPESFYQTSDEARRAPVSEICRVLKSIMQEPAFAFPPRVPPEALISPPVKHRCGRPFEQSHNESKAFFYLTNIHRTREKTLSYFTVNRDIFRAFFGHQHPLGFSGPTMTPSVADIRNEIRSDVLMAEPVTQNQQTTRPQPTLEEFSFTQGPRNIAPVEMRAVPHPATDSHVAREEPPDQNMQEAQPETAGIDEDVFIGDAPDEATETAVAANATTQPVAIPPVETAFVEGVANGATETAVAANATTQPVAIPPVETAFVEGAAIGATEIAAVTNATTQPVAIPPVETAFVEGAAIGATEIAAVANATTQPVGAQPVESVPENSPGQRIPWLPLSTPKKLSLFQEWERQCKEGDLFVVDVGKLEGVNYDLRASGPYKLPDPIISAAARHYFLVFTNNMMSSRRCAPVKVRSLRRYVKGPDYDGVVYKYIRDHDIFFSPEDRKQGLGFMGVSAFTRELPELGIEVLEGSTTESRLRKLEETHKKKKRTTNFPPDDLLHKKPFSMSSSGA